MRLYTLKSLPNVWVVGDPDRDGKLYIVPAFATGWVSRKPLNGVTGARRRYLRESPSCFGLGLGCSLEPRTTSQMIGEKIRDTRRSCGWSQTQLADAMNASQPAVSGWETGKIDVEIDTLRRVAFALGVDLSDLV